LQKAGHWPKTDVVYIVLLLKNEAADNADSAAQHFRDVAVKTLAWIQAIDEHIEFVTRRLTMPRGMSYEDLLYLDDGRESPTEDNDMDNNVPPSRPLKIRSAIAALQSKAKGFSSFSRRRLWASDDKLSITPIDIRPDDLKIPHKPFEQDIRKPLMMLWNDQSLQHHTTTLESAHHLDWRRVRASNSFKVLLRELRDKQQVQTASIHLHTYYRRLVNLFDYYRVVVATEANAEHFSFDAATFAALMEDLQVPTSSRSDLQAEFEALVTDTAALSLERGQVGVVWLCGTAIFARMCPLLLILFLFLFLFLFLIRRLIPLTGCSVSAITIRHTACHGISFYCCAFDWR
jgi:hypothetical protein